MRPLISMRRAISDPLLLGSAFTVKPNEADTWVAWRAMALAAVGEPLTPVELASFQQLTKRQTSPTEPVEELAIVKGRRSGGTTFCATMVTYLSALVDYSDVLGPGERATALLVAPSQRQAEVAFGRVCGLFDVSPLLASMVVGRTADSLTLNNNVTVEVQAASYRNLRGLTLACAVADEAAFFQSEGRNTDTQIMEAIRPALITTRGMLLISSSPYAAAGELWELHEKYFGKDGAPVLVAKAGSRVTNPSLPQTAIDRAMERDPVAARSEYNADFRQDVTGFIGRDLLLAAVDQGVTERPPTGNHVAFADAASGLDESRDGDSFTLSIGHAADDGAVIIDLAREWQPPFSAADVTAEVAAILKLYGVDTLTTDGFSSGFVRSELARHGIGHRISELSKSELYLASLPVLTSRRVRLLDNKKLIDQFAALERRPGTNGRDRVDARGHEDLSNSVAGTIAMLTAAAPIPGWGIFEFYKRQAEQAAAEQGPPTLAQEHGGEAILQIGTRPPRRADFVRVQIPAGMEISHVMGLSGASYLVDIEDDRRHVWCSEPDALAMIDSVLSLDWFELNAGLRTKLQEKHQGGRPPLGQGMRWSDWMQAVEDARPRHWNDRGGHVHDALRAVGRWSQ
jgi:hypothetical protein